MVSRKLYIPAFLMVAVLVLSACSAAVPPAIGSALGFLAGREASAPAAVTSTDTVRIASTEPSAVAMALAQGLPGAELQDTLQQIYETVNPSVVSIRVSVGLPQMGNRQGQEDQQGEQDKEGEQGQQPELPFNLPNLPNLPFNLPEMPDMPFGQGQGSGFVWDRQGHIVTNNHVVDNAKEIEVTFYDGVTVPAELVGRDPDSDLAVVKVDPAKVGELRPVEVANSDDVKVGQFAVALGNPFGLENTMTFGIVSARGRSIPARGGILSQGPSYTIPDIIQTDAPVNPGNSGGALLDLEGRLIGVPTAIESPNGASAGIGFAIPSTVVGKVVPILIEEGKFTHPYIGISGSTLSPDVAEAMDLPATQRGVLVGEVSPGSPAEKAGLQGSTEDATIDGQEIKVGGDVIVEIDGQDVKRFEDITTFLARRGAVGKAVALAVLRDGREVSLTLTLGARPEARAEAPAAPAEQPGAQPVPAGGAWLGIQGATLTPEVAKAMGLEEGQEGVLVRSVVNGSPADEAGLRGSFKSATIQGQEVMVGGDIIVAVEGQEISAMEQLVEQVSGKNAGDKVTLTVLRDGEQVEIPVTLGERPS